MEYSQAEQGRVFVLRLEDGDIIHEEIEKFAHEKQINAAALIVVGGVDEGSKLVVGPEEGSGQPIIPMTHILEDIREVTGTGTLFPDQNGNPVLHMHIASGRKNSTVTGCIRTGVKVWNVLEVILFEIVNTTARRLHDEQTGFELLRP